MMMPPVREWREPWEWLGYTDQVQGLAQWNYDRIQTGWREQALLPGSAGAPTQALPEIREQQLYVDIAVEIGV